MTSAAASMQSQSWHRRYLTALRAASGERALHSFGLDKSSVRTRSAAWVTLFGTAAIIDAVCVGTLQVIPWTVLILSIIAVIAAWAPPGLCKRCARARRNATAMDLTVDEQEAIPHDQAMHIEERKQELIEGGTTLEKASLMANNGLKPAIAANLYNIFRRKIEDMEELRHDPVYKQVRTTRKRAMDDEDFDSDEALYHAIEKRKFLIQKAAGLLEDLDDDEEEEEEEGEEGEEEDTVLV